MLPPHAELEVVLDHVDYMVDGGLEPADAVKKLLLLCQHRRLSMGGLEDQPGLLSITGTGEERSLLRVKAVAIHDSWLMPWRESPISSVHLSQVRCNPHIQHRPAWEELWLAVDWIVHHPHQNLHEVTLAVVPWGSLRRLALLWCTGESMTTFLSEVAPKLTNLQMLRLRAPRLIPYHRACAHEWRHGRPSDVDFKIDFSQMSQLRELEINGICNHVPIDRLVSPDLRALQLHTPHAGYSVCSSESQRTHTDILQAAKIAPHIERLELDIGYIDNLWHPTAIPGVDVDVEQYRFLDAITKFSRLETLRLFPPFVTRDAMRGGYPKWCLPVSDDQAIRIFEYLRAKCPSLQALSIPAIKFFGSLDTMCWEVKRSGDKTILTTRNAHRNYEHKQIWVGQRRITTEIKRYTYPRPYLSDSEGWLLSRSVHR